MRKLLLVAVLTITPAMAHARPKPVDWNISCPIFIDDMKIASDSKTSTTVVVYLAWAQGFMVAKSIDQGKENMKDLDAFSAETEINKLIVYCGENSDKFFADAVLDLYEKLPMISKK